MLLLSWDGCHLNHSKLYACRYPQTAVIWTVQSCYVAVILRLLSFEPFKAVNLPLVSDSCHTNCSKLLACRYPQMAVIWTVQSCYVAIILRWLSFEPFRTVISPLSSDGCHLNRSKLLSCRYPKIEPFRAYHYPRKIYFRQGNKLSWYVLRFWNLLSKNYDFPKWLSDW